MKYNQNIKSSKLNIFCVSNYLIDYWKDNSVEPL